MRPMKYTLFDRIRSILLWCHVRIRFLIGKHLKPKEPALRKKTGYPDNPVCPRCGDLIYCKTQCVSCGQRFKGKVVTVGEVLDSAGQ